MNRDLLTLSDEELEKFNIFLEEHSNCSNTNSLSGFYNVKLVFNINQNYTVATVYCAECGSEDLLSGLESFKEL